MSRNNYMELSFKGGSLGVVIVLLVAAGFLAIKVHGIHTRIMDRQKDLKTLTARTNELLWEAESALHLQAFETRQEARVAAEFKDLAGRIEKVNPEGEEKDD